MVDRNGDYFGFMTLTVPGSAVKTGKAVRMKITGKAFQKDSWYMTFTHPLKNTMDFKVYPAIFSGKDPEKQLGIARLLYTGRAAWGY